MTDHVRLVKNAEAVKLTLIVKCIDSVGKKDCVTVFVTFTKQWRVLLFKTHGGFTGGGLRFGDLLKNPSTYRSIEDQIYKQQNEGRPT